MPLGIWVKALESGGNFGVNCLEDQHDCPPHRWERGAANWGWAEKMLKMFENFRKISKKFFDKKNPKKLFSANFFFFISPNNLYFEEIRLKNYNMTWHKPLSAVSLHIFYDIFERKKFENVWKCLENFGCIGRIWPFHRFRSMSRDREKVMARDLNGLTWVRISHVLIIITISHLVTPSSYSPEDSSAEE